MYKSPVENELRRGLGLAFRRLNEVDGIVFDPEHFLETTFTKSPDGTALEYKFAMAPAHMRKRLSAGDRSKTTGSLGGLEEAMEFPEILMQSYEGLCLTGSDRVARALKCIKHKTFSHSDMTLPRDQADMEADFAQGAIAANAENRSGAIQARTLEDLAGGLNELLTALGVSKDDLVKIQRTV